MCFYDRQIQVGATFHCYLFNFVSILTSFACVVALFVGYYVASYLLTVVRNNGDFSNKILPTEFICDAGRRNNCTPSDNTLNGNSANTTRSSGSSPIPSTNSKGEVFSRFV
jgi:hypothetical protein